MNKEVLNRDLPTGYNLIIDELDEGASLIGVYVGSYCPIINQRFEKEQDNEEINKIELLTKFWKGYDSGKYNSFISKDEIEYKKSLLRKFLANDVNHDQNKANYVDSDFESVFKSAFEAHQELTQANFNKLPDPKLWLMEKLGLKGASYFEPEIKLTKVARWLHEYRNKYLKPQ